jgi:hypothetical protein
LRPEAGIGAGDAAVEGGRRIASVIAATVDAGRTVSVLSPTLLVEYVDPGGIESGPGGGSGGGGGGTTGRFGLVCVAAGGSGWDA